MHWWLRAALGFSVLFGGLTLWHREEPLRLRLGPNGGPVQCGPASTSSWSSSAPCFAGTIRIVRDACKATIRMPNGDLHEEAFPTRPDYLLFATTEHGWCHLDLANQRLACDYRCDESVERCDHACNGTVLPSSPCGGEARLYGGEGYCAESRALVMCEGACGVTKDQACSNVTFGCYATSPECDAVGTCIQGKQ